MKRIATLRRAAAASSPTNERKMMERANAVKVLRQLERGGVSPPPLPNWHPSPGSEWKGLDAVDPSQVRVRWFRNLYRGG
jgi:hypothetical protein